MYRLNNIKQNLLIISSAALLVGCDGTTTTDSNTTSLETTTQIFSKAIAVVAETSNNTNNSITLSWTLPDGHISKFVEHGLTRKYGFTNNVEEEGTITLLNLESNTDYHYRIVAIDKKGKKIVTRDKTFTTTPEPIVIEPIVEPTPEPIVEPNNPPEAQEVLIVGIPKVGETLTLDYKFIDIDGDSEGDSIIAWSTPTVEVQRGTSKTFLIPEELAGESLSAWVHLSDGTVVNAVGTQASNGYVTIEAATPIVEPIPEPVLVCNSGPAIQEGQVKDNSSGLGLSNVTVMIDGCITKTDDNGFYSLTNIALNEKAIINFEKDGYFLGSSKIQITGLDGNNTLSPNYLEYSMDTYNNQWSFDSQTIAKGGHIDIPASVYIDRTGALYNGNVSAQLEIQDITTEAGKALFPGAFEGENSNGVMQQFVSHGLISLLFKDANGNPLNFSDGTIATLTFDAVSSMNGANSIPLWYYDYLQGLWVEEGFAELQADGTYNGEISHPGTWSLNQPIDVEPAIYTDRIIYPNGSPAKNIRVLTYGDNWIRTDLSTDDNGQFEVEVIPGVDFKLKAYHPIDKYAAAYSGVISAIASGEVVYNH